MMMQQTQKQSGQITLSKLASLTKAYRKTIQPGEVTGGFFWKTGIERVIDQPAAVGMRYYFALREDQLPTLILVGVDENGQDLLDGIYSERSVPCPPFCGYKAIQNGEINHAFSLKDSADYTLRYRERFGENTLPGGYFPKSILKQIIEQEGCMGLRYFFGHDELSELTLVVAGVDAAGSTMVDDIIAQASATDSVGFGCRNVLNSTAEYNAYFHARVEAVVTTISAA